MPSRCAMSYGSRRAITSDRFARSPAGRPPAAAARCCSRPPSVVITIWSDPWASATADGDRRGRRSGSGDQRVRRPAPFRQPGRELRHLGGAPAGHERLLRRQRHQVRRRRVTSVVVRSVITWAAARCCGLPTTELTRVSSTSGSASTPRCYFMIRIRRTLASTRSSASRPDADGVDHRAGSAAPAAAGRGARSAPASSARTAISASPYINRTPSMAQRVGDDDAR